MMSTTEEAKQHVKAVSDSFGLIPDSYLKDVDEDTRSEIRRLERNEESMMSEMLTTLAEQIYGKGARFVFELLQNADDKQFNNATKRSQLPYMSLSLYSDRIETVCNEDGFTHDNLKSTCSIGESIESASHGYIGARGIGFESVLSAAGEVHIQSGSYSFRFECDPVEEEFEGPLTRMVLWRRTRGHSAELEQLRQTISQQLKDLKPTFLLFLRNLKKISLKSYDDNEELESSKVFEVKKIDENTFSIEVTETDKDGNVSMQELRYHVSRHMATGLTKSHDRTPLETEESKPASANAEVVLAFPLTSEGGPRIELHPVYAFLPTSEERYNFIIHSDFQTTASRKDIVTDSSRNIELLSAIADAFVAAIRQFIHIPALCFTWPYFLPITDGASNSLWANLNKKIKEQVLHTPVLKSRHKSQLRKLTEVYALTDDFLDENGKPLLDDAARDPFISPEYATSMVRDILEKYGLPVASFALYADLVRVDLESPSSIIRSKTTTEHWHSALAKILTRIGRNWKGGLALLRSLPIIPLMENEWVSTNDTMVYLPFSEGISVPYVPNFPLLATSAVNNSDRKAFYLLLGAMEPTITQVRIALLESYPSALWLFDHREAPVYPTLSQSQAHLQYLYLTHKTSFRLQELQNVMVYDDDGNMCWPHDSDIYLPSGDDPLGPTKLIESVDDVPAHHVAFVNSIYLENAPARPTPRHRSWKQWCVGCLGVRQRLRLVARGGEDLSDIWYYIREHKPKKLMAFLKDLWGFEGVYMDDDLKDKIRCTSGNSLCGLPMFPGFALSQTFLPLPDLQRHCRQFMEIPEHFPFLTVGEKEWSNEIRADWMFLHNYFNVSVTDNIDFLLQVAYWTKDADGVKAPLKDHQSLLQLYIAIQAKCIGADHQYAAKTKIRRYVESESLVYIPALDDRSGRWTSPYQCLWQAPPDMTTKYSLKHIYATDLVSSQMRPLEEFFKETLEVPDASWRDLTAELESLQSAGCKDLDQISSIYVYLKDLAPNSDDGVIRAAFSREKLIFVTKNDKSSWHTVSECLWSSSTEIRGKMTLKDLYEDLEDFFVESLGVKTLSLKMVYDDLLLANPGRSIDEAKSKIRVLNSLLQNKSDLPDCKPMLDASIFPIRYPDGSKTLRSASVAFTIGDSDYLETAFSGKLKFLDFTSADVRLLYPFLRWTGLTDRLLLANVQEIISVADDSARPIAKSNRDISRKSYALLRIAATCNSPRYAADAAGFYALLRTLRTIESDSITSVLSTSQDGSSIDVAKEAGDVYISEGPSGITIYVPMDRKKQEYCFASPLPTILEDWLMRDPTTQIRQSPVDDSIITAISAILNVHPTNLESILDHKGIIPIPIEEEAEDLGSEDDETSYESDEEDAGPRRLISQGSAVFGSYEESGEEDGGSNGGDDRGHSILSETSRFQPPALATDSPYLTLLKKVVGAGRAAAFPSRGNFSMSSLRDALPFISNSSTFESPPPGIDSFRSDSRMERNRKLGAAGELYVFEFLSQLSLPGWSRSNWQSTIRHLASLHPDYSDLQIWSGRETADLTYDDKSSAFTEILVENGYLGDDWLEKTPKYYMEVKTTPGRHGAAFYLSKYQYQRMKRVHEQSGYSEVYLIFRVFGVEEQQVGLKLYVDPEELRNEGELLFTAHTWEVTPR